MRFSPTTSCLTISHKGSMIPFHDGIEKIRQQGVRQVRLRGYIKARYQQTLEPHTPLLSTYLLCSTVENALKGKLASHCVLWPLALKEDTPIYHFQQLRAVPILTGEQRPHPHHNLDLARHILMELHRYLGTVYDMTRQQ